ncbi:perlucin-like [Diabrotica virgifera virgifera]|uniref:C-type lectin domain-containing protein n=1 Tax=Diabrotica virgifera virgifera TaxID=50390 RepID=A0ABM5II56_DIAVI|nr:perlucin-like [Diabrotica virgifera virgifera]
MSSCVFVCAFFVIVASSSVTAENGNATLVFDTFENLTDKVPSLKLIHFGRKSYYIGDIFKGNFYHAEQFCRYHGMNLVNIESKAEMHFLEDAILETGDPALHYWMSGTRLPDQERWISFTSARGMSYFNWSPGEPNNAFKNEYCIEMRFVDKELKWNDVGCTAEFNFICEAKWTHDCQKLYDYLIKHDMDLKNITDIIDTKLNNNQYKTDNDSVQAQ